MASEPVKAKKFKMPNTYVILFFILILVAILTWFIPSGKYLVDEAGRTISGTYKPVPANPQGIWNVIIAPIIGMVGSDTISGAITISLNVMLFGSFLELMDETGAINAGLKKIAMANKDNINLLITILVFIMGVFGTVQGAYEEGFVYVMMFMPIMLSLGLDSITVLMIVIFGTQAGCISSIVNPFSTGIAAGIAGVSPGEGIILRAIFFVVLQATVSYVICLYAKKVKMDPKNSYQYARREEEMAEFVQADSEEQELTKKQRTAFILFILTFVIMIIALVPWTSLNENWTFFITFTQWMENLPVIGKLIGSNLVPFGEWYFNEINVLLIIITFVTGYISGYSTDKIIDIFIKGAASLVSTAFIIPLARGIQVLMTDANITDTILHSSEGFLSGFSPIAYVLLALCIYIIFASFIPSSTGLAAATMAIMAPLGLFAGIGEATTIMIYNVALGLVKMVMPTSIIVMTTTSLVKVDYVTWLKASKKPLVVFSIVSIGFILLSIWI